MNNKAPKWGRSFSNSTNSVAMGKTGQLRQRSFKPTSTQQVAQQVKRGSKRSFAAAASAVRSVMGNKKIKKTRTIANFFGK